MFSFVADCDCYVLLAVCFTVLAPPEIPIYEMAENGKNCDQRRVAMNKGQHNGSFTGNMYVADVE